MSARRPRGALRLSERGVGRAAASAPVGIRRLGVNGDEEFLLRRIHEGEHAGADRFRITRGERRCQGFDAVEHDDLRRRPAERGDAHGLDMIAEALDGLDQPPVVDRREPRAAKGDVRLHQFLRVIRRAGPARCVPRHFERGAARRFEAARGDGGGFRLQKLAHGEDVADVLRRQLRHDEAAARLREEALRGERHQRFTGRHARGAELRGDLHIDQPVTGADFGALQPAPQGRVYLRAVARGGRLPRIPQQSPGYLQSRQALSPRRIGHRPPMAMASPAMVAHGA